MCVSVTFLSHLEYVRLKVGGLRFKIVGYLSKCVSFFGKLGSLVYTNTIIMPNRFFAKKITAKDGCCHLERVIKLKDSSVLSCVRLDSNNHFALA